MCHILGLMELFNDQSLLDLLTSLPLIGLYAESHFRFPIPFSRYFKQEPELIFDTPWRLEPGQVPTLFLVIKDAHKYPVLIEGVEIVISRQGSMLGTIKQQFDTFVDERQSHIEIALTGVDLPAGEVEILPTLFYRIADQARSMVVDNYAQTPKSPLRVTIAQDPLPVPLNWVSGDLHLHSSLTNDQIEFGASLEQTRRAAELFGLDFLTATDHSYDLDDLPDDYRTNDPSLGKWNASRRHLEQMNTEPAPTIIPGEEISVANARGSTVHFLHFNDARYFPGSGDSGEAWPKLSSELTIKDVLRERAGTSVSVAAHTAYKFPWWQRVLLKRGWWEAPDHENPGLDGVQILCGTPAYGAFHESRTLWIEALLKGHHLAVYGGSDGHGNFNRNWHVRMPVWSLGIHEDQIFAQVRTLLKSDSMGVEDLVRAMQVRRTALTSGPVGDLRITTGTQQAGIGDILKLTHPQELQISFSGLSTNEFGLQMDATLYLGNLATQTESILEHNSYSEGHFQETLQHHMESSGYIRLEISSEGSRWPGVYVSSPIWIEIAG